jgi:hypothetical protein
MSISNCSEFSRSTQNTIEVEKLAWNTGSLVAAIAAGEDLSLAVTVRLVLTNGGALETGKP